MTWSLTLSGDTPDPDIEAAVVEIFKQTTWNIEDLTGTVSGTLTTTDHGLIVLPLMRQVPDSPGGLPLVPTEDTEPPPE